MILLSGDIGSGTPDGGTHDVQTGLTDGVTDNVPVDTTGAMSNTIAQELDSRTDTQMPHDAAG